MTITANTSYTELTHYIDAAGGRGAYPDRRRDSKE